MIELSFELEVLNSIDVVYDQTQIKPIHINIYSYVIKYIPCQLQIFIWSANDLTLYSKFMHMSNNEHLC